MRPRTASARGLALFSLALAGCSLLEPLDGLSGSPSPEDAAPADGSTTDGPSTSDARPADASSEAGDATRPVESGVADASDAGDSSLSFDAPLEAAPDAGLAYSATVLADSPLAYWRMDETTGTTAHDASGNGNDATYTGGFTQGTAGAIIGDTDTATTLDGATGYLDAGGGFNFTGNVPFTVELWAQPTNLSASYQRLFSREIATTPREGYLVFVRGPSAGDPSTYSVERWAGGATDQCPQTASISQVWHHFVATYDGATSRVYLDGALAAAQPATLALNADTANLWIGASAFDTAAYFAGIVDEVAVYGSALSATRVAAHYHASGR